MYYSRNLQDIQLVDILQGVKGLDRTACVFLLLLLLYLTALQIHIYSNRLSGYWLL